MRRDPKDELIFDADVLIDLYEQYANFTRQKVSMESTDVCVYRIFITLVLVYTTPSQVNL